MFVHTTSKKIIGNIVYYNKYTILSYNVLKIILYATNYKA